MLKNIFYIVNILYLTSGAIYCMELEPVSIASLFDDETENNLNLSDAIDLRDNNIKEDNGLESSLRLEEFPTTIDSFRWPSSGLINEKFVLTQFHALARRAQPDGYKKDIESLLNKGLDPNKNNNFGQTCLHIACSYNNYQFIIDLLEIYAQKGSVSPDLDLNIRTIDPSDNTIQGATVFEQLIYNLELNKDRKEIQNNILRAIIALLLVHKNNIDDNYFPLHSLIAGKNINYQNMVIFVLNNLGQDFYDLKDNYGETILHKASRMGHIEIVKYLIEHKADLNIENKLHQTALCLAILNKKLDIVDSLTKNENCKINLELDIASKFLEKVKKCECVSEDKNKKIAYGNHFQEYAILYTIINNKEIGYKESHKAAKICSSEFDKILTSNNAYKELSEKFKLTPLHVAAINNNLCAVRAILNKISLQKNLNQDSYIINCKDQNDISALGIASIFNSLDVSSSLCEYIKMGMLNKENDL